MGYVLLLVGVALIALGLYPLIRPRPRFGVGWVITLVVIGLFVTLIGFWTASEVGESADDTTGPTPTITFRGDT